jgi:hypothetical protein
VEYVQLEGEADENSEGTAMIFGVNSDVSFLYMIGKMCAKSGHDLH